MKKFRLRGRRRKPREQGADRVPVRAIVPNLITSMAACAGITSISLSAEGRWVMALWALLIACVCDGVDGRVARLLNASSKLGAELDSLADFVNFGVAPAMFMFFWLTGGPAHEGFDPRTVRLVLGCSLFYALCDCFRLARFNTMLEQPVLPYWKHFFLGVPAPGGAWMVLTPAILAMELGAAAPGLESFLRHPVFGGGMLLLIGSLMASRLPTISLKSLRIPRYALLPTMAVLFLLIALLVADFWLTIGAIGLIYILTVPVAVLVFLRAKGSWLRTQKTLPADAEP